MKQNKFNDLKSFLGFLHKFQTVQRKVFVPNQDRFEYDAEHSYLLAMTAWYLIETNKYDLDINKVLHYALVHDLVESYTGDVAFFEENFSPIEKSKNEVLALDKIKEDFKEWPNLGSLIEQYELKQDKESQFVYALDKLLPIINNYMDGGRIWKKFNLSLDHILEYKTSKINISPEVSSYLEELVLRLKQEESSLFNSN